MHLLCRGDKRIKNNPSKYSHEWEVEIRTFGNPTHSNIHAMKENLVLCRVHQVFSGKRPVISKLCTLMSLRCESLTNQWDTCNWSEHKNDT